MLKKKQRDKALFRVRVGFVSLLTNKRRLAVVPTIQGRRVERGGFDMQCGRIQRSRRIELLWSESGQRKFDLAW